MKERGFTIVEVAIVMIIMATLAGLGTFTVTKIMPEARDREREADIQAIARGLEERYKKGNILRALPAYQVPAWPDPNQQGKNYYPGNVEMLHQDGGTQPTFNPATANYATENLGGIAPSNLVSPSGRRLSLICLNACQPAGTASQIQAAIDYAPTGDKYLYEPISSGNAICGDGNCTSFNLYWVSESDSTPYKGIPGLKVIRSKHR